MLAATSALSVPAAQAAQGEMGTGVPHWGHYGGVSAGNQTGWITVWRLDSASIGFPTGCGRLIITPGTMGTEGFKLAAATLLLAASTGRVVRFYAHAERDDGCGVDYVELVR
ncbi:hypothetical protein IP84_07030 [beta proteobacterium AAP99]|nr:hypothetical protein IP84_07030 [beta proteobacterium AAP99]